MTQPSEPEMQADVSDDSEKAESAPEERKSGKISFESAMATEEAVNYFEAIINGLRKGSVEFRRGSEALSLQPGARVNVEVKASSKGKKEKVTFELSWSAGGEDLEIS